MSKLSIVKEFLEAKDNIIIGKVIDQNLLPHRNGYWSHMVDFFVTPKIGIYSPGELQDFMINLIPPGLEPTQKDDFRRYNPESSLEFGKIYFDEDIGEERITRVCTLSDTDLLNYKGFTNGRKIIEETEPFRRRIWVRPFPSQDFLRDLLEDRVFSEFRATPEELTRYMPPIETKGKSIISKILGRR